MQIKFKSYNNQDINDVVPEEQPIFNYGASSNQPRHLNESHENSILTNTNTVTTYKQPQGKSNFEAVKNGDFSSNISI